MSLIPYEPEARHVRAMYEIYAAGSTLREIADAMAVTIPERYWSSSAVYIMLVNPVYCGDVLEGRRVADDDGIVRVRPASEWYGMRDAHPPIVPRELWNQVQEMMRSR